MLKIGVLGAGHFGKFHLQAIKQINGLKLSGFYDIDAKRSKEISNELGVRAYASYQEMLNDVDIVDIVVPTISHFDCAVAAIKQQKHVFLEKPVTDKLKDAETLLKLASEAQVKVQVGHIERFNPAFLAAKPYITAPMFIEIHRLAEFTVRSTDVSVIYNLMIHDIDIVLSVVKSNLKKVSASGVCVVTDSTDIANARLEFDNGCVANLTSSRISLKNMRRMRFFQKNVYLNVDCLNKQTEIVQIKPTDNAEELSDIIISPINGNVPKEFVPTTLKVEPNNAIKVELQYLLQSILENTDPLVTMEDGYNALQVADIITEKISSCQ